MLKKLMYAPQHASAVSLHGTQSERREKGRKNKEEWRKQRERERKRERWEERERGRERARSFNNAEQRILISG